MKFMIVKKRITVLGIYGKLAVWYKLLDLIMLIFQKRTFASKPPLSISCYF